jgi:trehalose 6-phosphate synthase
MMRALRHPLAKYTALAAGALVLIIVAVAPLVTVTVEGWSRHDVELRSRLVFRSIRDQVASGMAATPGVDLVPFFERLAEDERLVALGFCTESGELKHATRLMPKSFACGDLARTKRDTFVTLSEGGERFHVSAFPLTVGTAQGYLIIVHDLTFIHERARQARFYIALALIGVGVGFGLLATTIVLILLRGWTRSVRTAIEVARRGGVPAPQPGSDFPVDKEIQSLLSDLRVERKYADGIQVQWSPKNLHRLLVEELPGTEVMVVSNREPYIHNRSDSSIALQTPASGLVAALEPVMRACGGTWIAHGSGSADRETVDNHGRIRVPPSDPAYTLRRVWLTDEEQDGYYYGFANEGLWPLCHIAFVRPTFRAENWSQYLAVNTRFADVVVEEAGRDDPIVLVQDYHFALLPRLIRNRLPNATILTFWHIPWPNSEAFGICPWRDEILDGLLGSTILGFHTQFHCNNFLETTDRFLESRIDRERSSVTFGGVETMIRPYPISIEWPPAALERQAPVRECRDTVRQRFSLPPDARLLVGIERFDYTKGILDRMRAIDDLLSWQPGWKGKLAFLQVAAPTRNKLGAYRALHAEATRLADEINRRHGQDSHEPVLLVARHHEPDEVYELFRAADACIVSSLHDGMNLVAKEFVASRDDEQGVLILSSFAGASRELAEALIVNPYDPHAVAETIDRALRMPVTEQRERLRAMRELIRDRNVYRWAAQMLLDAARVRKRQRIFAAAH